MVSVQLRPTSPEDLDFVLDAERDPENARFILPWTREQHVRALADPDVAYRIIELESTRDRVGFVLLLGLTSPHGSLEFRRVVVTAKGRGPGRAAVRAVKRFAFEASRSTRRIGCGSTSRRSTRGRDTCTPPRGSSKRASCGSA